MERLAMTLGSVLTFLLLPKCNQGYPIAPTLCDEWCAAEQRLHCRGEDPASCVVQCENGQRTGGPPGRCDDDTRVLIACINALPDTAFSCENDNTSRHWKTCPEPALNLSLCQQSRNSGWDLLCSHWARECADRAPKLESDTWGEFNQMCTETYRSTDGYCPTEQSGFVDCLAARDLSCDVRPPMSDACPEERSALDACDPRYRRVCHIWSQECIGFDIGADAGPLETSPHSEAACMKSRPADTTRCTPEREALYQCLTGRWANEHERRCDILPAQAPACQAQNDAFEACTRSFDDGGFRR